MVRRPRIGLEGWHSGIQVVNVADPVRYSKAAELFGAGTRRSVHRWVVRWKCVHAAMPTNCCW